MPSSPSTRDLTIEVLSAAPRLYLIPNFAAEEEIAHVLAIAADEEALAGRGIETAHDRTGFSFEMPVGGDPVLEELTRRIYEAARMDNDLGDTMRFRRYETGEYHPIHFDSYSSGASTLIVTSMLYLTEPEEGGETRFPLAWPEPIDVRPARGSLVIWFGHKQNGTLDVRSAHEGLPVVRGVKATLTNFIYKPLPFARADILAPRLPPVQLPGGRSASLFHVDEAAEPEVAFLLRTACERRGVRYIGVDPGVVLHDGDPRLSMGNLGDLLYRHSSSPAAIRAEQRLSAAGVATFYRTEERIFFTCDAPQLLLSRAGVPTRPSFSCATDDPETLQPTVEWLGGLPLVMKVSAGETRVDSLAALSSLLALVLRDGQEAELCASMPDAIRWRVVALAGRALVAYREDGEVMLTVAPRLRELAVRALRVLGIELGEVEILEDPRGGLYVAGCDFPCDLSRADEAGVDLAGMMVDHLLSKAARFCRGVKARR